MITYLKTNLFDSPAQTLVNTVNTEGVMGKGVAKQFKQAYPAMFKEYAALCKDERLEIGSLHLWRGPMCWVLNFPTKTTWRQPSKLEYIERGLQKFVDVYKDVGITSVSFPPLGCGNGNLNWDDVRPVMESYLARLNIPVFIHDIQVPAEFVPEHKEVQTPPDFHVFAADLARIIERESHRFSTRSGRSFRAFADGRDVLLRFDDGKSDRIREEMMQKAYSRLRHSILVGYNFSSENEKRLKSYLFPILAKLPYVRSAAAISSDADGAEMQALFVPKLARERPTPVEDQRGEQGCLSL